MQSETQHIQISASAAERKGKVKGSRKGRLDGDKGRGCAQKADLMGGGIMEA